MANCPSSLGILFSFTGGKNYITWVNTESHRLNSIIDKSQRSFTICGVLSFTILGSNPSIQKAMDNIYFGFFWIVLLLPTIYFGIFSHLGKNRSIKNKY